MRDDSSSAIVRLRTSQRSETMPDTPDHPELISRAEVLRRTQLSRAKLYELIAAGQFPAPVALGPRLRAWPLHEVSAWITARLDAPRDTSAFGQTAEGFAQAASRTAAD